jgi:exodeoxyribonuclease V alpha subunit
MNLPLADTITPAINEPLTLAGQVARVTFHDEQSGFFVAQVKLAEPKDLVTFVGYSAQLQVGEWLEAQGTWINDRRHGMQFRCQQLTSLIPNTLEGIEKYLASGLIQGIGPHFAKKLIAEFGDQVFEVIENQPERLQQLEGIGQKRQQDITDAWQQQKNLRDIMVFLHSHHLGTARAYRIFEAYGDQAIDRVKANPYQLVMDVHGIGFKTADQLAQQLGVLPESVPRIAAALAYCLKTAANDGHCGLPLTQLLADTQNLIGVPVAQLQQVVDSECHAKQLRMLTHDGQCFISLPILIGAEQQIAFHLQRLMIGSLSWPLLLAQSVTADANEMALSTDQQLAVQLALSNKLCILTGGPGVGKTTVLRVITQRLRQAGLTLLLAAPTGRAAKRLAESTGLTAKTLHRLLQYDPSSRGFKHNASNPLAGDFLIIDEASMVDVSLMASLLQALPDAMAVLWVGDVDQLPSVGPGNVLADLINSARLPVIRLQKIFRQAAQSQIVQQAHRVNQGHYPQTPSKTVAGSSDFYLSDFYLIETRNPETAMQTLLEVVSERIPQRFGFDPTQDIQILTPMQRGGLGARSLNIELQKKLNANAELKIERLGTTYALGDKVIQVINNYDKMVFNGDIGRITKIATEAQQVMISFVDRDVEYRVDELDEVQLAYAITIHKSQGSEYPCVVMPILMQHFRLLQRNLLYTGMTRAKKMLVLIAQNSAIKYAVDNQTSQKRYTFLADLIRAL